MTKEQVNKKLIDVYGLDLSGQPKYRVVWSDDEVEKRIGEIEVWYGEIFVRKERGVHTVKKYSYLSERWVLEMLVPTQNPELMDRLGYEPIFVFQDGNGNYLPPNWDVITIVLNALANRPEKKPRSEMQDIYEEGQQKEKEKKAFRNYLDDVGSTDFQRKIRNQELILNPLQSTGD